MFEDKYLTYIIIHPQAICCVIASVAIRVEYENFKNERENNRCKPSMVALTELVEPEQKTENTEIRSDHQCESGKKCFTFSI